MIRVNIFPLSSLPGCTNSSAFNYDALADIDDGSCRIAGCTNELYPNFEPLANFDDGSCEIIGCDDPEADNYSPDAEIIDNVICLYSGCTNAEALNFNEQANLDDGSCIYNEAVLFVNEEFGCAPFSIEITNQTLLNEGAECSFNLGEGTILEVCELDAYTHTYDSPGVYTITYSYTVDDFISTAEITITVYEAEPAPLLDYLDDVNQITCTNCLNENSYNWILDNVIILEDAPFDLLNPENGTYILELDNGSNCTAQSNTLVVAVQEIGCNDPDADNYNPDADIIDNDTCLYSGCTDEEAINFDEQANLDDGSCAYNAAVLFVNEEFGCAPFSIEITNQTLLTEGAECSYNLGEGTILEVCELDAYTHTYDSPGTYTITYTYTVGEFISTDEITITVYEDEPDPILDYLSETNQITCTNCVSENSYNWILDDAIFLEDADFDLLNPQNGTYILELDNGSNCTAQSAPLQVTSVEEDILELEISIYPNPAREFIQISSPFSSFDFQIIDSSGKVVATGLLSSPGIHRIDFRKFSSGVYLLKSANKTYKIIKT
jgi:PKD repeat protein